jgi:hypothetical protein
MKRRWAFAKERENIRKEEERQRQEAAGIKAEEKQRCEQLERQVSAWTLACSIRQFVHAVREEATRRSGTVEEGRSLDQWVRWAERHAASLDPVGTVLATVGSSDRHG